MKAATTPLFTTIASYVPALIVRRFIENPQPLDAPAMEAVPAAVLFADISGFTALTERLAKRGPSGAEDLTQLLNSYFSELIELIDGYGGEVVKFAGDAVLALWPAGDEALATAVVRAADCALAIQAKLNDREVTPDVQLSLRIAIDAGDVLTLYLGGVYGRWELLVAGQPLVRIAQIGHLAAPGEVALTTEAFALAGEACVGQRREGHVRLEAVGHAPSPRRATLPPPNSAAETALFAYIPNAIRARLSAGQTGWLSELRPVAIIFVNLPDLDPAQPGALEKSQSVMRALQTALYRYEGSINKLSVDDKGSTLVGVLGLPPLSHEDDPARALLAALDMQAALRAMGIRSAIGVTSGSAFCGEVGSERRREYTVMGDVVNVAARLMQAAPESILCDSDTAQAARGRLTFEHLPSLGLKGKAENVEVYRPMVGSAAATRVSPIFGRDAERAALAERIDALREGRSSLVLIEGEAGIGKSRLVLDLLEQAKARGVTSLVRAGDATERATPYHAWRPIFAQLFDVEVLTEPEDIRSHVLEQLEADPELVPLAPLLNAVLTLDLPDTAISEHLSGSVRATKTQELLVSLLQDVAAAGSETGHPLVLVLEDAHWLDSASWALLQLVHSQVQPLLMVIAARPLSEPFPIEYEQLLKSPELRRVRLDALDAPEVRAFVCDRLNVSELPDEVANLIEKRAQGSPFFSQELAYALRDAALITVENGECQVSASAGDFGQLSFPSTIQGVITSRIDRLAPAHQLTLKVASVFGRVFPFRILRDVHPIDSDKPKLSEYLEKLETLDFTAVETPEPDLSYAFRHGLTQEVTYSLMLFSQRRQLHQAIAEWYERSGAEDLAPYYELLALHWRGAEVPTKAIEYYEKAGDQAFRAGIFREAIHFFSDALSLVETAGASIAPPLQAKLHRKLGAVYWDAGERERASGEFHSGLSVLETQTEHVELAHLHQEMGRFAFRSGDGAQATECAQKALDVCERLAAVAETEEERRQINTAVAHAHNTVGVALARMGKLAEAVRRIEQSVEVAIEQDLLDVACRGYTNLGVLYSTLDPGKAIEASQAGLELAKKAGHLGLQPWLYANLAGAYCTFTGQCEDDGIAAAQAAVDLDRQLGQLDHLAVPLIVLAQISQCHGSPERARECYEEALVLAEQMHEPQLMFPCYDGLATLYLEMDDEAKTEEYLLKGQAICEEAGLDPESLMVLPFLC